MSPDTPQPQPDEETARCGALTARHWRDTRTDDERRQEASQTCRLPVDHEGWHKTGGKTWSR